VVETGPRTSQERLNLLWYLWSGPRSPLSAKDRITTFDGAPALKKQVKNQPTLTTYLMIVTTADLYEIAYGKYAIAAYNVNNLEQAIERSTINAIRRRERDSGYVDCR
jgi:Firmicute fructose-1,6-bisphosphatase